MLYTFQMRLGARLPMGILLLAMSAACKHGPPRAPIWFDQLDISRCAEVGVGEGAPEGGPLPEGRLTLWLSVQADGTVPAAFFHDASGFVETRKLRCISTLATEARAAPQAADGIRPLYLSCAIDRRVGVVLPHLHCAGVDNQLVEQPFEAQLARDTLFIAEWASAAERGFGLEYAGLHDESIPYFRRALQDDAHDLLALRGLSQALAASGASTGDAGAAAEARALAEQAVQLSPSSSGAHEALLRACLAQDDRTCIAREQLLMAQGAGAALRLFSHAELDARLREAAARSQGASADGKELVLAPMQMTLTSLGRARSLNVDLREPLPAASPAPDAAARTPVVFLPGLGGGLRDFAPQLEHTAQERRAAAVELPGLGFSEPPRENQYALAPILDDVGAVLDSLSIDRCVLVAHGLGATVAIALAQRGRVAGLLLIDPLGDLTRLGAAERARLSDDLAQPDLLASFDLQLRLLLRFAQPATSRLVLREGHMLRADAAVGYMRLAAAEPIADEIRKLAVPVRIVRSRFDDEPYALAALLPALPARTVSEGSSWPMLDAPELVDAELDALLTAVDARGKTP